MKRVIPPGSTIGIIGGGQLGRMMAIAARRLGYGVHVYTPEANSPASQIAGATTYAAYEDVEKLAHFARKVDVATYEFENLPAHAIETVEKYAPLRPGVQALHTLQNRLREKGALSGAGLPVAPHRAVRSSEDLQAAIEALGTPAVLKTANWGYDGKGQRTLRGGEDPAALLRELGSDEKVLEAFISFDREFSVVGCRNEQGEFSWFGPIENHHHNHILDVSLAPTAISPQLAKESVEMTRTVAESLSVIGVVCVEFFLTRDNRILINEVAPRPHNSGHLTIDSHVTCQFEQHIRAICGLPFGSIEMLRPAAMANLLGDLWQQGTPDWERALAHPHVKLHLYGKAEPRMGRKMGHLTTLASTSQEASQIARRAREALTEAHSAASHATKHV